MDARRLYIPRVDQAVLQAERKRLEDEIERLRDWRSICAASAALEKEPF